MMQVAINFVIKIMQLDIMFYLLLLSRYLKISGSFPWKFLFWKFFFSNVKFDFIDFYITVLHTDVQMMQMTQNSCQAAQLVFLMSVLTFAFGQNFFSYSFFFLFLCQLDPGPTEGPIKPLLSACPSVYPASLSRMSHQPFLIFCKMVSNLSI